MSRSFFVVVLINLIATINYGHCLVSTDPADTVFYLFKTPEVKHEVVLGDPTSLNASGFLPYQNTFLIINGFMSNVTHDMGQVLKDALLDASNNTNVIIVDWAKLNGNGFVIDPNNLIEALKVYTAAMQNVPGVGEWIADFIYFIQTQAGVRFDQIHVLTHSMGCDLGGALGRAAQKKYGEYVGRITGLDPATLLFGDADYPGLYKDYAAFVDIIHTNRGMLGDSARETGHINIFVNGGVSPQPGCVDEATEIYCSHAYSWGFWTQCVISGDACIACPCSGTDCECASCPTPDCSSSAINVGLSTNRNATGEYYISTIASGETLKRNY